VRAAGRERERPPRAQADEPALGIERVEQREEVVLVGAAAVEQDEGADSVAAGLSDSVLERLGAQCFGCAAVDGLEY
jgi:hypothetical protein